MRYRRMPIEEESPEQLGYGRIRRNLAESSVSDAALADLGVDLGGLVLQYGDHLGLPELREAIAADAPGAEADDVIVTPGAVAALFILHTTLLEPGDHIVVARPNYATNVETPRAIGADVSYLDLAFEDGWAVDPARIAALMTPRTRLVSLTTPHNPTGHDPGRGDAPRGGRARRGPRRPPAPRRDLPRDDLRRAAPRGRLAEPVGDLASAACPRRTGCRASASAGW